MNKVYFDKEKKTWFVNEPEDFYSFMSINCETNKKENQIISWSRGFDLKNYPNHIRMYDVEIKKTKYFFLMWTNGLKYIIEPEDPTALQKLINDEKIFFVGDTLN